MSSVPHSRVAAKAPGPQPAPVFRQSSLPLPRAFRAPPVRLAPVEVPLLAERRFILLVKKVRPTPNQYPRSQGLPRKRPL